VLDLGPTYAGDLRPGDQILGIPRTTAGATVALSALAHTSLSLGVVYVGALTNYDYRAMYTGPSRNSLRDYWTAYPSFAKMNLGVSQTLSSSATAFAAIENVANSNPFEQDNLGPIQGRTSMIGLRLHF
jgi:hypothetical protein